MQNNGSSREAAMTTTTTTATTITTNQQQAAAARTDTFTLIFPMGRIAILEVRGAADQDSARAFAESALPQCRYVVTDGDQTKGHAEIFYLWCCAAAQEQQEGAQR
jgi:hypothetical protein